MGNKINHNYRLTIRKDCCNLRNKRDIIKMGNKINHNYELLLNQCIKIVETGNIICIGESETVAMAKINKKDCTIDISMFNYPNGKQRIDKSIWNYPLNIISTDGIISLIQIPHSQGVYFNNINLSKVDYKKTLNKLKNIGYDYEKMDDHTFAFPKLNLLLYCPNDELETIGVYGESYIESMNDVGIYQAMLKRANGVVIIDYKIKDEKA